MEFSCDGYWCAAAFENRADLARRTLGWALYFAIPGLFGSALLPLFQHEYCTSICILSWCASVAGSHLWCSTPFEVEDWLEVKGWDGVGGWERW